MTKTNESRDEFEAWYKSYYVPIGCRSYKEDLFAAWQARPSQLAAVLPVDPELQSVIASMGKAFRELIIAARTTGGTAGPDAGLMAACENAERTISLTGLADAMNSADSRRGDADAVVAELTLGETTDLLYKAYHNLPSVTRQRLSHNDLRTIAKEFHAAISTTPPKPGEDAVRLDYLENKLFFVDLPDDREADEIQLHIRVGNINDRTVVLAGEGKTLRDAIDAAMALTTTQQAGEKQE